MLPLNRNERTPQNKLVGMRIAFGEATWDDLGDGDMGYVFQPDVGFRWDQDELWLATEKGVDVDALIDCVEQIEDQLGGPDSVRDQFGIFRGSGHAYLGLTAQSRIDPRVTLNFTPTSVDGSPVSAYFEWYLREGDVLPTDDAELETEFARLAGISLAPDAEAPAFLPAYEDAARALAGMPLVEDDRREAFLERLFRLEKTLGAGYREAENAALLAEWSLMTEDDAGKQVKDALRGLKSKLGARDGGDVEFDSRTGVYSASYRAPQYFEDRRGEEDDDDPTFVGFAKVKKIVDAAMSGLSYGVETEVSGEEKAWFSVTVRVLDADELGEARITEDELDPDDDADPRPREAEGKYSVLVSKMAHGGYTFSVRGPDGGIYAAPGGSSVKSAIDAAVKYLPQDARKWVADKQGGKLPCYYHDGRGDPLKKLKDAVVESRQRKRSAA